MKRYLYILLGALALASCEPTPTPAPAPIVEYHFGEMTVVAEQTSATITVDMPYKSVDGVRDDSVTFSLGYHATGLLISSDTMVESYSVDGGRAIFEVEGLEPATEYIARLYVDDVMSEDVRFVTKKHTPITSITCSAEVASKGLMATVNLSDVAYLVDGEPQSIHVVKLEYSLEEAEESIAREFSGGMLNGGAMSVELPFEGCDYLVENSNYHFSVTIYPKNGDYEPKTSDSFSFKTRYAEVTANIATPQLTVDSEGIHVVVEGIQIFYDGVAAAVYKAEYPVEYYLNYHKRGTEQWSQIEVQEQMGDISATIPMSELEKGATYEFEVSIVAGADRMVCRSSVAEITLSSDTPPTPPVGGEGDTSTITGTWHLSEWRGAKPSFDVYMSITEDGVVTLWQRIESREWECFYSRATIEDGIITGQYTDGVAWGASYSVTVADDSMTWVDTADATDISVYTRSELPEGMTTTVKRASVAAAQRFL